jgi:hypothetical protein
MAEAKTKKGLISHGIAAQNRKARFDYSIKDTVEAGLVLKGPEVKSLRNGRATLSEAWAGERDGELWLFNAYSSGAGWASMGAWVGVSGACARGLACIARRAGRRPGAIGEARRKDR